jgi:peptidoglycan/LPS O-acetylase OafA/YrhL
MKKIIFMSISMLVLVKITNAQVGIGNATPNAGSILDLTNTNDKALILPTSTAIPTSVGTFTVSGMMMYFNDKIFHPSFYTLSPILGVCLIIWFVNKNNFIYGLLSSKLFVGTGLISYSLYLWHYPIFAFSRIIDINLDDNFSLLLALFS